MDVTTQAALLEEYKVCDSTVDRLDNLIWQMASIIFPITLAGLAYFGVSTQHTVNQFIILAVVAVGSIILTANWYFLSRQWASYQKVAIYRMREIERELGNMWLYRYSGFFRLEEEDRSEIVRNTADELEQKRLEKVQQKFHSPRFYGLFTSMAVLSALFILAWLVLIVREIFFTFLAG